MFFLFHAMPNVLTLAAYRPAAAPLHWLCLGPAAAMDGAGLDHDLALIPRCRKMRSPEKVAKMERRFPRPKKLAHLCGEMRVFLCLHKWLPEDSEKDDTGNKHDSFCLCKVPNLPRKIAFSVQVSADSCSTSFALYIKPTRFHTF